MEKTSIRGVSRVLDHHRDTISKYYHLIGKHAEILNDHYIRGISPGDCEFDEIWSFIQKKTKTSFLMIRVNMEIFGHILVLSEIQG